VKGVNRSDAPGLENVAEVVGVRELLKLFDLVVQALDDGTVVSGVTALLNVPDLVISVFNDDDALELIELVDSKIFLLSSMISDISAVLSLGDHGIFLLGALSKTTAP
jgi:hypothetical protein